MYWDGTFERIIPILKQARCNKSVYMRRRGTEAILLHSGIQRVEDKMLRAQQERWRREMDDRRDSITLTVTLEFAIQLFQTCNLLCVRILCLTLSAALKLFI